MNESESWLTLRRAPGLSYHQLHHLHQHYGSAARILDLGRGELAGHGLKPETIAAIRQPASDAIANDLEWLSADDHHLVTLDDARYPPLLRGLGTPPPVLYVWGDPDYLLQPQLAMVGSRNPSAPGRRTAQDFAAHLSRAGITITSGLANGIDGASHRGALQGIAGTIAVVAHGLDIVYPAAHRGLAGEIAAQGALVSELPIGTEPLRPHFPQRNRIISGLSMGTLVVEAALNSGSLITARHAGEQGREVFAIPGSIHNPMARGCHRLIRNGAKLVETAEDILEELAAMLPHDAAQPESPHGGHRADAPEAPEPINTLDPDHQKLLKCLAYEPVPIDTLVDCSGFTASEVASMLLILELEGCVVSEGGRYTRVA